jgi:hypothetical protein
LDERRKALLVRSESDRAGLASIVGGLERKFAVAEAVVATARGLSRHRALVSAAGVFLVVAPLAFRSWIRRAMWLVPLAIGGYRAWKAHDDARGEFPEDKA